MQLPHPSIIHPILLTLVAQLAVYNREVARTKRINLARNLALTSAVGGVTLAAFIYLVAASTLADPAELYRRYRGEAYMRSYYRRPDVVAAFWAVGLVVFYYVATILTYYLLQNLFGYAVWDASVVAGTPSGLTKWCALPVQAQLRNPVSPCKTLCHFTCRASCVSRIIITVAPSLCYAILARGLYMFHYRYIDDSLENYHEAATVPILCSPSRVSILLVAFFSRSARTSDTGKVYLIRIYMTILVTFTVLLVASLHTVYSFMVPFIFRMNHIGKSTEPFRWLSRPSRYELDKPTGRYRGGRRNQLDAALPTHHGAAHVFPSVA